MAVLSDREIYEYIRLGRLLVEPFDPEIVRENGLDLRLGTRFCLLEDNGLAIVDSRTLKTNIGWPLEQLYKCVEVDEKEGFIIPPRARVLAHTLEYIVLPNDLVGLVNLRSTFARLGLYIPPTVVDAGFRGQLTIELVGAPFPVRVYPGQRFLHLVLVRTTSEVLKPYDGKYQGQRGVTLPKPDQG